MGKWPALLSGFRFRALKLPYGEEEQSDEWLPGVISLASESPDFSTAHLRSPSLIENYHRSDSFALRRRFSGREQVSSIGVRFAAAVAPSRRTDFDL